MIFLEPKIIKGSPEKIIILLFYWVFQFFTLAQVGTGQIYYFREFINLPRINLKSFYCMSIYFYLAMSILVIIHSKTILIKTIQTTFIPFNQFYVIVSKHKSIFSKSILAELILSESILSESFLSKAEPNTQVGEDFHTIHTIYTHFKYLKSVKLCFCVVKISLGSSFIRENLVLTFTPLSLLRVFFFREET